MPRVKNGQNLWKTGHRNPGLRAGRRPGFNLYLVIRAAKKCSSLLFLGALSFPKISALYLQYLASCGHFKFSSHACDQSASWSNRGVTCRCTNPCCCLFLFWAISAYFSHTSNCNRFAPGPLVRISKVVTKWQNKFCWGVKVCTLVLNH